MMEKILSFQIDHTKLTRGMYLSRVDGDIDTFDLRTRLPNREPVMENGAIAYDRAPFCYLCPQF